MSAEIAALFHTILQGEPAAALDEVCPFYPLTAPGMPLPGPNFVANAVSLGDQPPTLVGTGSHKRVTAHGPGLHYLYRRALFDEEFRLNVSVRGHWAAAPVVPGHLLGDETRGCNGGPRRARVMLIGKHPGREEVQAQRNFVGPTSGELFNALDELGVTEPDRAAWYITNVVKWPQLDPQSDSLAKAWLTDCAVLLEQEIRLVRPDYILCLGSDASKFLLGVNCGVQSMVGRVNDYTVCIHETGEQPLYHTAKVMAVTHPAQVYRRPEMYDSFKSQIALFISLTNGADLGGKETFIQHRNIYKTRDLAQIVERIRGGTERRPIIAVDAEWHGQYPTDPGAYLRTIQFSAGHGEGCCVVLRHQGGSPAFQPAHDDAIKLLGRLLKYDPADDWYPRIGGHFFRADLPWLYHEGLDLRTEYMPAETPEACREFGGWDTSLMYHAYNESTSYGLEDMTARCTTIPRYDVPLAKWKTEYCKQRDIPAKYLEGYGLCPPWILHPESYDPDPNYAAYDPDATRRIAVRCMEPNGFLDCDWFGMPSWEPYWVAHRASLGFLEMEMNGILLDKGRVDELAVLFMEVQGKLLQNFRQRINWPSFNSQSAPQCVVFLFGERFSAKRDKVTGDQIATAPPGAVTLNLTPITTTGKRPKLWSDIAARGEAAQYRPSANKEVLGILGHAHPLAMMLRDVKFISQVLSGTLRRPSMDEATGMLAEDEEGNYVYEEGLPSLVHADGRVRTHLSQVKETGRASSYRPPLQNISSRRESDYSRILGYWKTVDGRQEREGDYLIGPTFTPKVPERYFPVFEQPLYRQPIRTIFRAKPGCVLVSSDYIGAELALLAWMAGDRNMIEHVRLNNLPETHPQFRDMHSHTAVNTFRLTCDPTKKAMKKAGLLGLRVAAKNIAFGVPYGRSAEAIARQCREEGVDVSVDDAQRGIDFYFEQYASVGDFLAECRRRSQEERWLCGIRGRRRRFITSRDRGVIGEQERQAQNYGIQNGVAEKVNEAIYNFCRYRWEHPDEMFWLLLQIHDALLFEVPIPLLRRFVKDETDAADNVTRASILRECMVNRVPVWPRYLDNTPIPLPEPYFLGIDFDISVNWGEELQKDQALALGIDADLL